MKKSIFTISVIVVLALFSIPLASEQQEGFEEKIYSKATVGDDFDGGSVLVVMDKNTGGINKVHSESFFGDFSKEYIKDLTELTADIKDALIDKENFRQIFQIKLKERGRENVLDAIRQLEKIEGIVYAGPDYFWYPAATVPNDTYFGSQWALPKINAPETWDITKGSSVQSVGIIDTGIASHPDLNANLISGWNFVRNNSDTGDTDGHGTHVAGIVGAVGNNNTGVSGVNWNIRLVPLKIDFRTADGQPTTNTSIVISAINYAKNNSIPIVNFSWGGLGNDNAFFNAITGYSGLFVCAAGNNSVNIGSGNSPIYPASWTLSNLITVGAANSNDARAAFSNYSSTAVDLFAPGENIRSTLPANISPSATGYDDSSGTSMAAPFVTGVAALIKSQSFWMTAPRIKSIILDNVDTVMPPGLCTTNGRLNAYSALDYTVSQWKPCTQNCAINKNICVEGCKESCLNEILMDPTCPLNPGLCQVHYGTCMMNCDLTTTPCTVAFDSCIAGC